MTEVPVVDTTWFDDDEELTEIDSSDEEDDEPIPPPPRRPSPVPEVAPTFVNSKATRASTQDATKRSRARGGLKPATPCLKPPRTVTYSVASIFDWIKDQLIELNPEYQRGVVWNDAKQTALIGSIFSNYYVPPIVFTVVRKSDGSEMRICIDGKQRLTSMYRFLKGEIAHKDATSNRKSYFVSPTGAKRKLITPQMQANFRNKQITCVEYEDLTGEQEREIFQRVQLGVALAPADRLPAINGPYANLVRNVRRRIETTQGFELYLDWGKARGKDFQALAQIVYLIAYGHQPRKAEPTSMRLEAFLSNQSPEAGFHTLQENANNVMDIFCRIAQHWDLGKPLKKLLSPMEFVMSSYLVFLQRKKLSDTQLSDAMAHMRRDFKSACPDLKCNQKNFKHILSFVQKEVPKLAPRLRRGPPEERSSFEVPIQRVEVAPRKKEADQSSESCFSVKVVGKRKRAKAEEEESQCSDDAYIAPVKKKAKAKLKPESKTPTLDQAGTSAVATETKPKSRVAPSARSAKTVVKKSPAKNKAGPPSTAKASISTSASAPASASASIGKTKTIQPQVGKPSVRPPPSARTASASTIGKVASLSNVPRVVSAPSAPSPLPVPGSMPSRPLARPPLPGRSHTPLPASASASPIVPDATLLNVPQEVRNTSQVASRTDSSYAPTARPSTTTGGSDGGPDRLGPLRNAKAALAAANQTNGCASKLASASTLTIGSSSSVQGSSSWIGTSTATGERKPLPKFTKTSALASEPAVSPADVDAKWQADVGGLLNAVGGGNGKQPPLGPRKFMEGRPPSRSTPMVSAQVLAPSTAANVRPGGSSSSSTPTPSPSIPPHVPGQLRPAVAAPRPSNVDATAVPPQQFVTRDPRLIARETAAQASSAAATSTTPPRPRPQAAPSNSQQTTPSLLSRLQPPGGGNNPTSAVDNGRAGQKRARADGDAQNDGECNSATAEKRGRSYPGGTWPCTRPDDRFNR